MQQADGQPHRRRAAHRVQRADLSDQAARAHARARGDILHLEDQRRQRAQNGGGDNRWQPDLRIFHDIGHLQHTGAQALAQQPRPAVVAKTHDRKADHLGAAADCGRTSRQAVERQGNRHRRAGNRQRQQNTHDDRHQNTHQKRLQIHRPHNQRADFGHGRLNRGADELGGGQTRNQSGGRRGDDIHGRGFINQLAELRPDGGGDKAADRPTQSRTRRACGNAGKQHQRRGFQRVGHAHAYGCAHRPLRLFANFYQPRPVQPAADGF